MSETKFTAEFIQQQREIITKATKRPCAFSPLSRGFRILGGEKHRIVADMMGVDQEANGLYLVEAANNYPDALDEIERLRSALLVVLDQVDYTSGNCGLTNMISAVLPQGVILMARDVLKGGQS